MDFNVERNTFLEGIQKTLGIVERKTTIPILNNVLIKTDNNQIRIIATDREIGLISDYKADIVIPGEITVSARKLFEMVREIQGDVINIKKMDNNWVNITCAKIDYRIPGIATDDFPEVPDNQDVSLSTIPCSILKEMIHKTFFAISNDEMKVSLTGVFFHMEKGLIEMVATDGHRLSIAKTQYKGEMLSNIDIDGIIIPRKGVSEIRKLVDDETGDVQLGVTKGVCIVKKGSTLLRVSLLDAEYPDYHKVIPEGEGIRVQVDRDMILHSLKRMSVISSERFSGVKIKVANNKIVLSSTNPDVGEANDEIDISYSGKECEMGYNVKYLIDAIDVIAEDSILIEMREAYGPGVVMSSGSDKYICVIMPLRL